MKSLRAGPMELGCCEAHEPKKPVTLLASFFAARWITLEQVVLPEPLVVTVAGWLPSRHPVAV